MIAKFLRYYTKNYLLDIKNEKSMKKDSKKYEDIREYELKALEDIKRKFFKVNEKQMRSLAKGTFLGVVLGIGSSIFFLSLLHLIDGFLVTANWEIFSVNMVMCVSSLVAIVIIVAFLRYQIRWAKDKLKLSRESIDVIEYAIKRRQYNLK
ncbi:MAG: hypothetical protein P8Y18_10990 [Candidatus Bathyarchaeota archaeon]